MKNIFILNVIFLLLLFLLHTYADALCVKVSEVNLRGGPGTKFMKKAYSPSLKYDSYKAMQIKCKWVKVRDEFGDTGWIFRKLLWVY